MTLLGTLRPPTIASGSSTPTPTGGWYAGSGSANIAWVSGGPGQPYVPISTAPTGATTVGMSPKELRAVEAAAKAEATRVTTITGKEAQYQKALEYEMAKRGIAYTQASTTPEGISEAMVSSTTKPLSISEARKMVESGQYTAYQEAGGGITIVPSHMASQHAQAHPGGTTLTSEFFAPMAQQYPTHAPMQTGPGGEIFLVPFGAAEAQFVEQHPGGMTLTDPYAQQQYEAGVPINIMSYETTPSPQLYFGTGGVMGIQQPSGGLMVTGPQGASYEFLPLGYDLKRRKAEAQKAVAQSIVAARATAFGLGAAKPSIKATEFYMGRDRVVPEGQLAVKHPSMPSRITHEATEFITGEEVPYQQHPALIQYPYYYEDGKKKYFHEKDKPTTIPEQVKAITQTVSGLPRDILFLEERKAELQRKGQWGAYPELTKEYMETRAALARPYILTGSWPETVEKDIIPFLTGFAKWEEEQAEGTREAFAKRFGEEEAKYLPQQRPIAGLAGMGIMAADLPSAVAGIPVLVVHTGGTAMAMQVQASSKLLTGDIGGYLTGSVEAAAYPFAAGASAFVLGPVERAKQLDKEFPGVGGGYLGGYALFLGFGAARVLKAPKAGILKGATIGKPGAPKTGLVKVTDIKVFKDAVSGREIMAQATFTKTARGKIHYAGRGWGKEGSILRGRPTTEAFAEPFAAQTAYLRKHPSKPKWIEVSSKEAAKIARAYQLKGGAEAVTIGVREGLPPAETMWARLKRTVTGKEPPKAEIKPYATEAYADVFLRAEGEVPVPKGVEAWTVTGKARPLKAAEIIQTGVRKTRAGPTLETQAVRFIDTSKPKPTIPEGRLQKLHIKPPTGIPETMMKYRRSIYESPDFYRRLVKGIELTKKEGRYQPPEYTKMKAEYTTEDLGDFIRYNLIGEAEQMGMPVKIYETGMIEKFLGKAKVEYVKKEPVTIKRIGIEEYPKVTSKQLNEMLGIRDKPSRAIEEVGKATEESKLARDITGDSAIVVRDMKRGIDPLGKQVQLMKEKPAETVISRELQKTLEEVLVERAATTTPPGEITLTATKAKPIVAPMTKEGQLLKEVQKEATTQMRQVEEARTPEMLRTEQVTKTMFGDITKVRPMEATITKEKTIQDLMTTQVQELTSLRDLQKLEVVQVQKVKPVEVSELVTPVITELIVIPEIVVPLFLLPGLPGVPRKEKKEKAKKKSRETKYKPSIAAIVLGIRKKRKPKQKYFTGHEVRPMVGKKSTINKAMRRFGL